MANNRGWSSFISLEWIFFCKVWHFFVKEGLVRELNPGPLAPEARIIPLDQRAWAKDAIYSAPFLTPTF